MFSDQPQIFIILCANINYIIENKTMFEFLNTNALDIFLDPILIILRLTNWYEFFINFHILLNPDQVGLEGLMSKGIMIWPEFL